jgi:hypothetical protein
MGDWTVATQKGAALMELVVVAPLVLLMAMAGVQFAMLQQARLNLDYAAYEAVRAGARKNASPSSIRDAWYRALVPMLVSTRSLAGLKLPADPLAAGKEAREAAIRMEQPYLKMEILNPSKLAFDDFADPALQKIIRTGGARVIANDGLETRPDTVGSRSGVSIQDANVLKLRITYGYQPRIPLVRKLFTASMALARGGGDPFRTAMLEEGRIPIVVDAVMPMISPAIENAWMQSGKEEEGNPSDDESEAPSHEPDSETPVDNSEEGGPEAGGGGESTPPGPGDDGDFCSV